MIKKYVLLFAALTALSVGAVQDDQALANDVEKDLVLYDQIELVIFGESDVEIVTKADMVRPSFGGGSKTQEQLIFEKSVLLDAKKHNVPCDEETIDTGMDQMKREYNLSQDDLEAIFNESGYTMQEGRDQFRDMHMINMMFDAKVRSHLIIPRKEIDAYCSEHPESIEATYTLERFFVPFVPGKTEQEQRKAIVRTLKTKGIEGLATTSRIEFVLNHSEIAPSKRFIYSMKLGSVAGPFALSDGFELFRLTDKVEEHLKTVEERYHEVADILRRPKYEKLMQEYRDYLMKNISIIYF